MNDLYFIGSEELGVVIGYIGDYAAYGIGLSGIFWLIGIVIGYVVGFFRSMGGVR